MEPGDGLGRVGYRILATLTAVLAVAALVFLTLEAKVSALLPLLVVLAFVGVVANVSMVWVLTAHQRQPVVRKAAVKRPEPQAEPTEFKPAPRREEAPRYLPPQPPAQPVVSQPPVQPRPEPARQAPPTPAQPAPARTPAVGGPVAGDWPVREKRDASGKVIGTMTTPRKVPQGAVKYTHHAPTVRTILTDRPQAETLDAPIREIYARLVGEGPEPADCKMGKCGKCESLIWAPNERPLRVRCPKCSKSTLLR